MLRPGIVVLVRVKDSQDATIISRMRNERVRAIILDRMRAYHNSILSCSRKIKLQEPTVRHGARRRKSKLSQPNPEMHKES